MNPTLNSPNHSNNLSQDGCYLTKFIKQLNGRAKTARPISIMKSTLVVLFVILATAHAAQDYSGSNETKSECSETSDTIPPPAQSPGSAAGASAPEQTDADKPKKVNKMEARWQAALQNEEKTPEPMPVKINKSVSGDFEKDMKTLTTGQCLLVQQIRGLKESFRKQKDKHAKGKLIKLLKNLRDNYSKQINCIEAQKEGVPGRFASEKAITAVTEELNDQLTLKRDEQRKVEEELSQMDPKIRTPRFPSECVLKGSRYEFTRQLVDRFIDGRLYEGVGIFRVTPHPKYETMLADWKKDGSFEKNMIMIDAIEDKNTRAIVIAYLIQRTFGKGPMVPEEPLTGVKLPNITCQECNRNKDGSLKLTPKLYEAAELEPCAHCRSTGFTPFTLQGLRVAMATSPVRYPEEVDGWMRKTFSAKKSNYSEEIIKVVTDYCKKNKKLFKTQRVTYSGLDEFVNQPDDAADKQLKAAGVKKKFGGEAIRAEVLRKMRTQLGKFVRFCWWLEKQTLVEWFLKFGAAIVAHQKTIASEDKLNALAFSRYTNKLYPKEYEPTIKEIMEKFNKGSEGFPYHWVIQSVIEGIDVTSAGSVELSQAQKNAGWLYQGDIKQKGIVKVKAHYRYPKKTWDGQYEIVNTLEGVRQMELRWRAIDYVKSSQTDLYTANRALQNLMQNRRLAEDEYANNNSFTILCMWIISGFSLLIFYIVDRYIERAKRDAMQRGRTWEFPSLF